jgi:prophage regulatory protein
MSNVILRLPQVKIKVGLSRSSIYAAVSQGKFPHPIRLGARAVGWVDSEVESWLAGQIEQSREAQGERSQVQEPR